MLYEIMSTLNFYFEKIDKKKNAKGIRYRGRELETYSNS